MAVTTYHRDYARNVTVLRVLKNGMTMAQQISSDAPLEVLEYSEIIKNGTGEIYTQHQQDEINKLKLQLSQKEEVKKQSLKNLIAYYYRK